MAAMVNGNPASDTNSSSVPMHSLGKQQPKNLVTGSKVDGSRKQSSTLSDGNQRRAPLQKAWSSGMNPITQRSTTPGQPNGTIIQGKPGPKPSGYDGMVGDKGLNASLTMSNGDVFTGIFFGASMDKEEPRYLLRMVQQTRHGNKAEINGVRETMSDYVGVGDDHAMSFNAQDVVDLAVDGAMAALQDKRSNGVPTGFRTDADIAGHKIGQERELQPWVPPPDTEVDQSLESSGSTGTWDQFQANENLFGVRSDYDESIYTSRIDKSHPNYREREAAAMRMAQKMGESSSDVNEAECWDEEENGVRREATEYPPLQSTQPNRYQPPARRPPTGKPTVRGAPVDPAIISSQIARPEVEAKNREDPGLEPSISKGVVKPPGESPLSQSQLENGKDSAAAAPATAQADQPPEPSRAPPPSAAKNVGHKVLSSFKQWSEKEKTRVADDRRQRVIHDKTVKLNELRGFSKNFKLNTPVPSDLVPILAKDKKKQDEIMEKAQRNAELQAASPAKSLSQPREQVATKRLVDSKRETPKAPSISERQDYTRQGVPPRGPQASLPLRERQGQAPQSIPVPPVFSPNEQGLTHRLAKAQRDRQAGIPVPVPAPLPIHTSQKPPSRQSTNAPRGPSSQTSTTMRTPTSATSGKFNVKAMEFVPNPAANSFLPTAQASGAPSPKHYSKPRTASRASSPSEFFGKKPPIPPSERPSILESFNPLKRLKEKAEKDGKVKDYAANGGIAFAHATSVTWTTVKDGEEGKSYKDMFEGVSASTGPSPQPSTVSPINPNLAHRHQLPAHLQHGSHATPPVQTQPHAMYHGPPHQHLYPGVPVNPQIDDQRMHPSPSISAYSTPRIQNSYNAYPVPLGQPIPGPVPGAFPYPPPMGPGHPQVVAPGGPQPPQFRHFAGVPQYIPGQQLAAPMMVQQNSQGPYMTPQVGQVPVYASGVIPSYGPSQPPSGFPSPSRGVAPMMVQQGSYQGQNPQLHAGQQYSQPFYSPQPPPPPNLAQIRGYPSPQPPYVQSSSQQYHYPPPQANRMPSHGYGHHSHGPPQMPPQQYAPPVASAEGGEPLK
ncbi:MAG: hypothetical protein Q9163_004096 [Psora crenata]